MSIRKIGGLWHWTLGPLGGSVYIKSRSRRTAEQAKARRIAAQKRGDAMCPSRYPVATNW